MALDGTIVFEVRTDGNDDNGGGYSSDDGGTDYSQQAAAELTLTDLANVDTTTTLTSVTGGFMSAMVDNLIQIKSGTNFITGWYRITVYTDTNTVTIDRTACDGVGDASAGTGSVGGALATPGTLSAAMTVSGMTAYIGAGTYTITTTTPGSNGPILTETKNGLKIYGYNSTRGDLDGSIDLTNNPVISAGTQTTVTLVHLSTSNVLCKQFISHITADGNNQTGTTGFSGYVHQPNGLHCKAANCTVDGFKDGVWTGCLATGCLDGFNTPYGCVGCTANGNTTGFRGAEFLHCLAYENTDDGIVLDGSGISCFYCTSAGNTGDGFSVAGGSRYTFAGCLATGNGAYGLNPGIYSILVDCAGWNNTSGNINGTPVVNINFKTLSADPYVDSASDDYRPNTTAGAGALLRGASIILPGQVTNQDISAVQHADPAGINVPVIWKLGP